MRQLALIIHNVRSAHNVGSMLRTADGLGVNKVYLTGYTPYPKSPKDDRLPHLADKIHRQIAKTSLGAENTVSWAKHEDINSAIHELESAAYEVAALEQSANSIKINGYAPPEKIALVVGNEVEGIDAGTLDSIKIHLEIPMYGKKESFNVANATAMSLFYFRFFASGD